MEQFLARKQDILRSCESLIGFKRGILSEVEAAERTATEITSSEGDYNLTIQELQAMLAERVPARRWNCAPRWARCTACRA